MTEIQRPRLAIVITCYNYSAFVADAIESILSQNETVEIAVVDDCSTDNSREIIASFGDAVTPVFQDVNQGHGGGFNAGFTATRSNSELVMFLDADDFLLPGAIDTILNNYEADVVMYHYRMRYTDETGDLGDIHPPLEAPMAEGDLSRQLRENGRYNGQITSGLVYSRTVLDRVMPMPADAYRQGGDGYLSAVVPLYGPCRSFDDTISGYRLHGLQHSKFQAAYAKRARWRIGHDDQRYRSIREHSAKLGLEVSDDLSERDREHLHERMVSLLFDPESHPIEGDDLAVLKSKITRLPDSGGAFWGAYTLAPPGMRRTLMRWKIDPQTRPALLARFGRFLRRRFGIVVR